jgi:hypothetical protein
MPTALTACAHTCEPRLSTGLLRVARLEIEPEVGVPRADGEGFGTILEVALTLRKATYKPREDYRGHVSQSCRQRPSYSSTSERDDWAWA